MPAQPETRVEYRVVGTRADGSPFTGLRLLLPLSNVRALAGRVIARGGEARIQRRAAYLSSTGLPLRETPWIDVEAGGEGE